MKKTLLLTAVAAMALSAFAQEGTDITPANYKFYNGTLPNFHPLLCGQTANQKDVNIGPPIWSSINGDEYWNDGLIVTSSGGGLNQQQCEDFHASWNSVDFGGEIGKVALYIGKTSKFVDYLNDYFPERSEEWNKLKVMSPTHDGQDATNFGGGALNFFLDPKNCPTSGYIHAKFVMNIFHPEMSGDQAIQYIGVRGDQNDNASKWGGQSYQQDPPTGTVAVNNDICMTLETGEWDPSTWMTYEFDFTASAIDDNGVSYVPSRMKMFFTAGGAMNDLAIMIREVSFTHYTDGAPSNLGKRDINTVTMEHELDNPEITTSIGEITSEAPEAGYSINGNTISFTAPAAVYNLVGQKVAEGMQATLASGVYVAKVGAKSVKFIIR